jgi:hypothetical protein
MAALAATGLTGIHFHDLRHAGNLVIAQAGANLRELMERLTGRADEHQGFRFGLDVANSIGRERRQGSAEG